MNDSEQPTEDKAEQFVQLLTENQNRIHAYVFSLIGDQGRAADVVQETNMVLWRKIKEFDASKPFLPWAFAFARMQVLSNVRNQQRDRLVLDEELIGLMSEDMETNAGQLDLIRQALRSCLGKLSTSNKRCVELRYFASQSIADVAQAMGKTASAIKVALLRSRNQLGECIQRQMAKEPTPK